MAQLRFQVGVPRAGSAARSSEQDEASRPMRPSSLAGSAARQAEQRRNMEAPVQRTANTIALRATGGRVADSSAAREDFSVKKLEVSGSTAKGGSLSSSCADASASPAPQVAAVSTGSDKPERPTGQGAISSIASHLSSLTRSLFLGTRAADPQTNQGNTTE